MTTAKKYSLPRDFAEKWVAALRSGEYAQARERLGNSVNGYCCLGVACKVAGAKDEMLKNCSVIHSSPDMGIPQNIQDVIPNELKGGVEEEFIRELIELNDDTGFDFHQIADWIEINVEFV